MNLGLGNRSNSHQKIRQVKNRRSIELNQDSVLVINLPDSRILGIIYKSLFLGIFILALPSIASFVSHTSKEQFDNPNDFLPLVFKDLVIEGVFKYGQKGLVLSSGMGDLFDSLWFLNDKRIDIVDDSDSDRLSVIPNEVFDFVFASSLENARFINRVVKVDGIAVMPLGKYYDRSYEFLKQSSYKIVYLRRFDLVTIVAMRKVDWEVEEGVFGGWIVENHWKIS